MRRSEEVKLDVPAFALGERGEEGAAAAGNEERCEFEDVAGREGGKDGMDRSDGELLDP